MSASPEMNPVLSTNPQKAFSRLGIPCLLLLLLAYAASAAVTIYPAPKEADLSRDYAVTVDGQPVDVYRGVVREDYARSYGGPYSFAYFDLRARAEVKVTSLKKPLDHVVILPESKGVTPKVGGDTLTFTLDKPCQLSIEPDSKNGPLLLFVNPPEQNAPKPDDARYKYFGPGWHEAGAIQLKDNDRLYIAGGAVVNGGIAARGTNITIAGRGILNGLQWPRGKGPTRNILGITDASEVTVEGIIVKDGWMWNVNIVRSKNITLRGVKVLGSRCENNDGIDICNSQHVLIEDCFVRTDDDCITPKGMGDPNNAPVEDVTVQRCVLWTDKANVWRFGAECRAAAFRNIVSRDIDVIHTSDRWGKGFDVACMLIEPAEEMPMENIRFENIRIRLAREPLWGEPNGIAEVGTGRGRKVVIAVRPQFTQWARLKAPGRINGCYFKDITISGEEACRWGLIHVSAPDEQHLAEDVVFENVRRYGSLVTRESPEVEVLGPVRNVRFVGNPVVKLDLPNNSSNTIVGAEAPAKGAGMTADSPVQFPKEGALPAKYPPDVKVQSEPAEKDYFIFSSPCRSLAQIAAIQKEMPPGQFSAPLPDWTPLQRTRRILTEGGDLHLLALGDSIVNDTMRSGWVAKLQEAYPKATIQATVYVRGGGGCQHYKEEDRIAKYVIPRKPNLVFIGGISQKDIESIREVIRQLRAGLPAVEILLATGTFGTADPRDPAALAAAPHSGTGAYGRALKELAGAEHCAYLDMTTPWAEYIRSAKVHPHLFYRDVVHANEYGEQILAKIMMASWTAPELPEAAWLPGRLQWFQDQKFGFMMHWEPYSQWGCIESWPLVEEDKWARPDDLKPWVERGKDMARFTRDYWQLPKTFNPAKFNPRQWAATAKDAGMKYVVFTTKHHDGFSMFDTRLSDYRITSPDVPFHANARSNVVREVFNAFRKEKFAIGAYFSKADWHCPDYWDPALPARTRNPNYDTLAQPEKWRRFVEFTHGQIEELMTGYGPIDILWLDAGQVRPPRQDIQMDRLAAMARSHQPRLIVVDRSVGGRYENYRTPEQEVPEKPLPYVWETCMTMGDQWSFKPDDKYKSTHKLIHLLVDVVGKGGNFLLNVGPQPDGELPAEAVQRMKEIGAWMKINGEAIYGSRYIAPYKEGQVVFTQKAGAVYAIYLTNQEGEGLPERVTFKTLKPAPKSKIQLLGARKSLAWATAADGTTTIEIPAASRQSPPCRHAFVFKFTLAQ